MKNYFVNEAKKKMSFSFCAPKKENEAKENDEKFFEVYEGKDESFYKRLNKAKDEKL